MAFGSIYSNKRVLVTGDTGFKGSYLAMWLTELGAEVLGVSLPPQGEFSHFELLDKPRWRTVFCDIRDRKKLAGIVRDFQPDALFHLAAQPLVRLSYLESAATFDTNVIGTLNLLEALRQTPACRSAVIVTSDKCYENRDDGIPRVESDPVGGFDPYSTSKGMIEFLVNCYRRSFFAGGETLIASARAGNVIGGGDWAPDRLIPDLMRGAAAGETAVLRHPDAVRPWQHVFEPLSGYLLLGARMLAGDRGAASAWNFGPADNGSLPVRRVAEILRDFYPRLKFRIDADADAPHEAALLRLDCSKSFRELHWHGVWDINKTLEMTAKWYAAFYEKQQILSMAMLDEYTRDAAEKGLIWTK